MEKSRNYIPNDGYTLPGFVDARIGFNEEVRFTYRPVTAENQARHNASLINLTDTAKNPAAFRQRAELLHSRLTAWDIKDRNGELVGLTVEAVRGLSPEVFWKMYGIVLGTTPTDIDPNWDAETCEEEAELANQAVMSGRAVGDLRDEANRGN